MALSMDEQRILAQIEQQLSSDDPRLAARLSSFGGTGRRRVPRMPRDRVAGSAAALVAVAIVSLIVYALIPFRALPQRGPFSSPSAGASTRAVMTASSKARAPSPRTASSPAVPAHGRRTR
ncbi:MAG: DUF3040 domain-containing protein [Actinobacteria bacterium]|nr:DUF3040 domain-containing protein [Actinomycetota bacterium]